MSKDRISAKACLFIFNKNSRCCLSCKQFTQNNPGTSPMRMGSSPYCPGIVVCGIKERPCDHPGLARRITPARQAVCRSGGCLFSPHEAVS
ncbi:hypothetical protein, partial [Candidatus Electronema sp. TJ]|uniref:hypothetical protein n=1 Tax=Candidatus Electronema sp. TJ TaxID=3401573 RepID=UPI003AA7D8DD